jgi:hypothetical protein
MSMHHLDPRPARRRRLVLETWAAFACTSGTVATWVSACGGAPPPVDTGSAPPSTADGAVSPPIADASPPAAEGSGSEDGNIAPDDVSQPPVDTGPDVGPYIDAPFLDHQGGPVPCNSEWWATDSAFDTTVTPPSFSSAVNPIVVTSSIHPFTLAVTNAQGTGWTGTASGTATNGNGDQYFPPANPATATSMTVTSTSVATDAPETTAWFHIYDAAGNDIWIPIANVALSAQYGDTTCDTLVNGTLTAVILASASSTVIKPLDQAATTMGALLGTQTSTSPAGWNVQMAFDASSVQVD